MGRVRVPITNLLNGISQQPQSLRRSSQAELQVNGMSSVVEGLIKRPPTRSTAKILNTTANNTVDMHMHIINRDVNERYRVYFANSNVRVFDLDGTEKTVTASTNTALEYLETATPSDDVRAVTIADYTLVVNKAKTVTLIPSGGRYTIQFPSTLSVNTVITVETPAGNAAYTVNSGNTSAANVATHVNTALNTLFDSIGNTYITSIGATDTVTVQGRGIRYNEVFALYVTTSPDQDDEITVTVFAPLDTTAIVYVKQGNYAINYTVSIFETATTPEYTFTHTTSATNVELIKTDTIAAALNTGLQALGGATFNANYTCVASGSLLKITPVMTGNPPAFTVTCRDSNGDRNLIGVQGRTQTFSDLPAKCFDGLSVKITGDSGAEEDDYYVTFNGKEEMTSLTTAVEGDWVETVRYGTPEAFEPSTMPHTLVRNADGTFTFGPATWGHRAAGNVESSPPPSFVLKEIKDILFFRNRLGFLADDKIILTEAGEFFSFWRQTVQALLDSDTIDVAASSTKVALLRYGISISEKMVLFSDQQQFVLSAVDLLTPKTVSCKPSTNYETLESCSPVVAGSNIYFPTPRGDYAGIRAYTINKDASADTADDITSHVPNYIPSDIFKMAAATNEDLIIGLTRTDEERIYVYRFFMSDEGKLLQASWSHWEMGGEVLDAGFIGSDLHLVIQRQDGVYQEVMSCEPNKVDTGLESQLLLDRRILDTDCTLAYNSSTDLTTLTLPYAESDDVQAVVRTDTNTNTEDFRLLNEITLTRVNTTVFTINGDAAAVPMWIGVPYTFTYEFSEQFVRVKDATTGAETIVTGSRLQLMRMKLLISKTGYFRAEVTPDYGRTYVYPFTTFVAGQSLAGVQELVDTEFRFPINSKSDRVTIELINDSYLPCRFQSAEWTGVFTIKEKKV